MKRKHLLSALMAVLMVISMMAIVVLPTGAEIDLSKISPVTAATGGSATAQNFKISTIEELIYAAAHPTYYMDGDVIYLANDLDISTYGDGFAEEFLNFNPAQDGKTEMNCTFDGLGHTIYNYRDDRPFFNGRQVNVIQNLTFENAEVICDDASQYTGVILRTVERHVDMINCHIRNCYSYGMYGGYNGGFVAMINNNTKSLNMVNCTMYNYTLEVDTTGIWATGLFCGRQGAKGTIELHNCIAVNSVLKGKSGSTGGGGGLLVGEIYNTNYDEVGVFDNVAVFNCGVEYSNAKTAPTAAITVTRKGASSVRLTYDNVYAGANYLSTDATTTEDDIPMPNLFYNIGGDTVYSPGSNVVTDATVTNALYRAENTSQNIPVTTVDPTFGLGAAILLMNKNEAQPGATPYLDWGIAPDGSPIALDEGYKLPMKMTFVNGEDISAYYTDIHGVIATDAVSYQLLRKEAWVDSDGKNYPAKSFHWDELVFAKSMTFTAHEMTITSHGDGTHSVICLTDENCVDNQVYIPCSGYLIEIQDSTYYGEAALIYRCSVCGYEWEEPLGETPDDSPITLTYNAEGYEAGKPVQMGVDVKSDSGLVGYTALLEYDHDLLTYINYSASDKYLVQLLPVEAGVISLVVISKDGTPADELAEDITLSFRSVADLKEDTEAPATIEVLQAVTKADLDALAENVNVFNSLIEANAAIYGKFTPGDVDGNGKVELLDAILLIEMLEGTIEVSDEDLFVKRAANVDGDMNNEVNTADVTFFLRYLAEWGGTYENLNSSKPNPDLTTVG